MCLSAGFIERKLTVMEFIFLIIALVIVITIHEFAHAWTANRLGDPTARLEGRISLNPFRHLDPVGTLMIFLIHIGWGKPVPVNPSYFKNRFRDEALTALAGPLSNLVLAVVCAVPLKYFAEMMFSPVVLFLGILMDISLVLFAFNMLPFPPLDGSKFLSWFVPKRHKGLYEDYLRHGIMYFLIFLLVDRFLLSNIFGFSILSEFIGFIYTFTKSLIFLGV